MVDFWGFCSIALSVARTVRPHVGPRLNRKIFDILLRFWAYCIAIIADIEKAFLMISIAKKDRDGLQFLWYGDAFGDQLDLMEFRFTQVVFGVSSSPFLLNATIRHHLKKYEAAHRNHIMKLHRSLYVDNLACGAEDEEQAHQKFTVSKKILEEGDLTLGSFIVILQHCKPGSILMPAKRTTLISQNLPDISRRHM